MDLEIRKIFLTYRLEGSYLLSRGEYSTAKISKTSTGTIIDTPSKVIKAPIYSQPKQCITLGSKFIEAALERPKPPKRGYQRWQRTEEGKLYMNWNKMKEDEKIAKRILIYVQDMTGKIDPVFNFEII